MRTVLLVLALMLARSVVAAEPDWVSADRGRVQRDGRELVFAVAKYEGSNIALGSTTAQNHALARLAELVRQSVPSARGGDGGDARGDMFAEMGRSEAGAASQSVTLHNAQLTSWRDDDEVHGIAFVAVEDLVAAIDDWPVDAGTSDAAKAKLRAAVAALDVSPDNLPRPADSDMITSSDKPPWVDYGCGSYQGKKGRVFFGVGIVSGMSNHALARSTSDNRARAAIARCIQTTVIVSGSGFRFNSSQNLWGVMIATHWFGPGGEVYALAEVSERMMPSPSEPAPRDLFALMEKTGREPRKPRPPEPEPVKPEPVKPEPVKPVKPEPAEPPKALATIAHECSRPRRGRGMRVAMGVIGPEASYVRTTLESELRARGFALNSGSPNGQLALRVVGSRVGDELDACLIEVELLRGAETATKATYPCGLGGDPESPERVRVADLQNQLQLIKCNIADNLWLAAKQHLARPRPAKPARKSTGGKISAQKLYIEAVKLETGARYADALPLLRKCVKSSPDFAPCYKSMGLAYMQLGQKAKARAAYEKYLALAPRAPDATVVKRILKTL